MGRRPCPLCDSPFIRVYVERTDFAVLTCERCGLRYLDPQPSADQLVDLYGEAYFARAQAGAPGYDRYLEEMEHIRRTFDERLRFLPKPDGPAQLVDVGAAIGLFVERARYAGWNAQGLEPSAWAARYARDILKQPVRPMTLEQAELPIQSTDLVTMWEVIEHLPDPKATLMTVARVLRPGGVLALSTPDAGSRVARLMGRTWPGWKKIPEHLFFFDRTTLRTLLDATGFRIESMRYVSLIVSRGYLLDRISDLTGLKMHRPLPSTWLQRPIKVNPLYDLMIVARRL